MPKNPLKSPISNSKSPTRRLRALVSSCLRAKKDQGLSPRARGREQLENLSRKTPSHQIELENLSRKIDPNPKQPDNLSGKTHFPHLVTASIPPYPPPSTPEP